MAEKMVKKDTKKSCANAENKEKVATKVETKNKTDVNVKKESQTKKSVYRVLYDKTDRLWKIKKDDAKRVICSYPTKEEALQRVKELCESMDLNFVVHKKDGKFQKKANINIK